MDQLTLNQLAIETRREHYAEQQEQDALQKRQVIALESIAKSLEKLSRLSDAVDDVYDVGTVMRVRS